MTCPLTRHQLSELEALLSKGYPDNNGRLVNLFGVPSTSWSRGDDALYLLWWCFRPLCCTECGEMDRWYVNVEEEYRCGSCAAGQGALPPSEFVECDFEREDAVGEEEEREDLFHAASSSGACGSHLTSMEYLLSLLRSVRQLSGDDIEPANCIDILRMTLNIAQLVLLPDMEPQAVHVLEAAAFYVSCSEVLQCVVAFPHVQKAAGPQCDLQWIDVQHVSDSLGLPDKCTDFFWDLSFVQHYVTNAVGMLEQSATPDYWLDFRYHQQDDPDFILKMKEQRRASFSFDHMGAIVALELMRRYEQRNPADERLIRWRMNNVSSSELLLEGAPAASVLLFLFSAAFFMQPMQLLEMVLHSGIYQGKTRFSERLKSWLSVGDYNHLPLYRRTSPYLSCWEVVHSALHSDDRYPLLVLLHQLANTSSNPDREMPAATKFVQDILRRQRASANLLFYYCIRVIDEAEKQMIGVYFCTNVNQREATFCHVSAMKTITFVTKSKQCMLKWVGGSKKVSDIQTQLLSPTDIFIEGTAATMLLNAVRSGQNMEQWAESNFRLNTRLGFKREMKAMTDDRAERDFLLRFSLPSHAYEDPAADIQGAHRPHQVRQELKKKLAYLPPDMVLCMDEAQLVSTVAAINFAFEDQPHQLDPNGTRKRKRACLDDIPALRRQLKEDINTIHFEDV